MLGHRLAGVTSQPAPRHKIRSKHMSMGLIFILSVVTLKCLYQNGATSPLVEAIISKNPGLDPLSLALVPLRMNILAGVFMGLSVYESIRVLKNDGRKWDFVWANIGHLLVLLSGVLICSDWYHTSLPLAFSFPLFVGLGAIIGVVMGKRYTPTKETGVEVEEAYDFNKVSIFLAAVTLFAKEQMGMGLARYSIFIIGGIEAEMTLPDAQLHLSRLLTYRFPVRHEISWELAIFVLTWLCMILFYCWIKWLYRPRQTNAIPQEVGV